MKDRLLDRIESLLIDDDLDAIGDELDSVGNDNLTNELFLIMERHPFADFGVPGPMVHHMEAFSGMGYEESLKDSLYRKPIQHTVWMLNRHINSVSDKSEIACCLSILIDICHRQDVDIDTKHLANHFYELHMSA